MIHDLARVFDGVDNAVADKALDILNQLRAQSKLHGLLIDRGDGDRFAYTVSPIDNWAWSQIVDVSMATQPDLIARTILAFLAEDLGRYMIGLPDADRHDSHHGQH